MNDLRTLPGRPPSLPSPPLVEGAQSALRRGIAELWPYALALLYAAFPVDFIPDVIPIAGLFDDVAVLALSTIGATLLAAWRARPLSPGHPKRSL